MDNELLKDTVLKLKDRIIKTEAGNIQLSETDTRQGLINPLFRALQWDFGDFESIKPGFPICLPQMAPPYTQRRPSARNSCSSQHRPA